MTTNHATAIGITKPDRRIAVRNSLADMRVRVRRQGMELATIRERPLTRALVDEEAQSLLPTRRPGTAGSTRDPAEIHANALAARRFFKRVDGLDLRHQHAGHPGHAHLSTWHRWITAPIDPLTPEEAATVGAGAANRGRGSGPQRLYVKNQVRPVGMTLERAIEIAQAAQDAVDSGTAPTYV